MAHRTIIDCPYRDGENYDDSSKGSEVVIGGQDCPYWISKEEEIDKISESHAQKGEK